MKRLYSKVLLGIALIAIPNFKTLAETVDKTLYINKGDFHSVNDTIFPALAYNETSQFQQNSSLLNLAVNDRLILTIQNNDNAPHTFLIKNIPVNFGIIQPGQAKTDTIEFDKEGAYIYYDNIDFPKNNYLGLSGLISVSSNSTSKTYYWNLKEHQVAYNRRLSKDTAVDWKAYEPEFFTINGYSYPHVMNDTLAAITGSVGDSIKLIIANTGQSSHAIHFHGFHLKILYSSKDSIQHGWIKDSFPMKSMETMVLLMVPDKVGEYSVHDHNLMALSGALQHPLGMMMVMTIE